MECLVYCDYSLTLKAAVHYSLCGATICKLGTDKHMAALVDRLNSLELFGCFGMTELGHGSNVMGIETTVGLDLGNLCLDSVL